MYNIYAEVAMNEANLSKAIDAAKDFIVDKTNAGKAVAAHQRMKSNLAKVQRNMEILESEKKDLKRTKEDLDSTKDSLAFANKHDPDNKHHIIDLQGKLDQHEHDEASHRQNVRDAEDDIDRYRASAQNARNDRNSNIKKSVGKLAAAGIVAAGATAVHDYKKHGDALYRVHRMQEKRAQRKALKNGELEPKDPYKHIHHKPIYSLPEAKKEEDSKVGES